MNAEHAGPVGEGQAENEASTSMSRSDQAPAPRHLPAPTILPAKLASVIDDGVQRGGVAMDV